MDTVCGAGKFTGAGGAEYPCVRRLRHRRLISFLWLQGLEAPTKLITRETFFSVMDLRQLVEWGQWSDAVDHLSRFLPPPDTDRPPLSLSVEAAVLHRFLVVHMALADIVAGARFSDHVATLYREYFSRDRAVCQGNIRLRCMLRSIIVCILHTRHQERASLDWECVQRRAAEIVYNLAYQTPELRQLALMPGGPMDPHNVLPIWSGLHRSSHVKKQACGRRPSALALATLYLQKRSRLPSLSQESPDDLLTRTLNWVADILGESLRAGKRQDNPLQIIGKEGELASHVPTAGAPFLWTAGAPASETEFGATASPVSQTAFGSFTGPTITPGMPSAACAGKLSSNVPTPGTPFLGTRGAPVSSLSSHCGNSCVASVANAGAIVAPVSQTMFGTLTDPAKTLRMPSVANAGKSASCTLTPGAPFSVTDNPVFPAIDYISSTPGVRTDEKCAHVAAVTQTRNLASHSQNSGITEHLDQEGSNTERGFNPKKKPREELTTSDEQDLHPKRQRPTGAFGKASLTPEAVET